MFASRGRLALSGQRKEQHRRILPDSERFIVVVCTQYFCTVFGVVAEGVKCRKSILGGDFRFAGHVTTELVLNM